MFLFFSISERKLERTRAHSSFRSDIEKKTALSLDRSLSFWNSEARSSSISMVCTCTSLEYIGTFRNILASLRFAWCAYAHRARSFQFPFQYRKKRQHRGSTLYGFE